MFGFLIKEQNKTVHNYLVNLVSVFCLLLPALYNGYPIVTSDSGSYISAGWILDVPIDRPITYSIFIRMASLSGFSLWGVLIAQSLILVYYLKRMSKHVLQEKYSDRLFLILVLLLTSFSSLGWVTSQIMPDIFTPILLLAVADYYLTPNNTLKQKTISFILLWIYIEQHNSNLLIELLFCTLVLVYCFFKKHQKLFQKTRFLFILTIFSFVSISFFNLWEGNSFRPSASSHVFMMSRMAENGILDQVLEEYCLTENYSICEYQGRLGNRQWDFMWDNENGHLQNAGGWQNVEKEYNKIIFKSLTKPRYLLLHIYEAAEASVRQMSQFTLSFMVQGEGSSPYNAIKNYLPREIKEYITSKQQCRELNEIKGFLNGVIYVFTTAILFLSMFNYNSTRDNSKGPTYNYFFVFVILTVSINAIVTASFSTVVDRLQARVFWLVPFACLLFLIKTFDYNSKDSSSIKHPS